MKNKWAIVLLLLLFCVLALCSCAHSKNLSGGYYWVTFRPNNGAEAIKRLSSKDGSVIVPTVTNSGSAFTGWYSSEGEKQIVNSAGYITVYEDITLYARWEREATTQTANNSTKKTTTESNTVVINASTNTNANSDDMYIWVTFFPNNGNEAIQKKAFKNGIVLPPSISYSGHTFKGWYNSKGEKQVEISGYLRVGSSDISFYAGWDDNMNNSTTTASNTFSSNSKANNNTTKSTTTNNNTTSNTQSETESKRPSEPGLSRVVGENSQITITEKTINPSLGTIMIAFDISDTANPSMSIKIFDSRGIMITPKVETATLSTLDSQNNIREMELINYSSIGYKSKTADDARLLLGVFSANTIVNLIISSGSDIICKTQFTLEKATIYDAIMDSSATKQVVPKVGDWGIAGYVFYDKGYYSDGWRFLEACPNIIKTVGGSVSIDEKNAWYDFGEDDYFFGYASSFYNMTVNTRQTYDNSRTSDEIGAGYSNTQKLKNTMIGVGKTVTLTNVADPYTNHSLDSFAIKAVNTVSYMGYSDWYLPSVEELKEVYRILRGKYPSKKYWTSSLAKGEKYLSTYSRYQTEPAISYVDFSNGQSGILLFSDTPSKNSIIVIRRF